MEKNKRLHEAIGLSNTEKMILSSIFVARNVQEISKDTGISRTGINYCLTSLLTRQLVRIVRDGKRRKYIALNSDEIISQLQSTIDRIRSSNTIRKGVAIKTSIENEFIIHVGTKEIIPAYTRIASESKNQRIRAIQHHRSWTELINKISQSQLVKFNEAIKTNHLILDGMLNNSAYQSYKQEIRDNPNKNKKAVKSLEGRMADYTTFDDNFFNHNAEIWIFKNTTLIINWYEEVAIEITNSNITGFLKDMFELVKKSGKKIDHNKAVRDVLNK